MTALGANGRTADLDIPLHAAAFAFDGEGSFLFVHALRGPPLTTLATPDGLTLLHTDGTLEGLHPDALIIDFGTTGVPQTKEFAKKVHWVDAPVSGGQVGAEAASLTIMAGGTEADFQRALPVFEACGKNITHMGPSGSGQVAKLANQLIVAQTIDAVAQALRMAELSGVDPALVRKALLGGFAESRILDLHGSRMVRRDFAPGGRATPHALTVRAPLLVTQHRRSSPAPPVSMSKMK